MSNEKQSTRNRILETGGKLLHVSGSLAVGIDLVIADAGIAKAIFYNHSSS
jgi:AcrR family transcriptional regulator